MKKILICAVLLCTPLLTGGCTSIASGVASIATNLSSSTPSQVTTLADAVQAADTITKLADTYVTSGVTISKAQLLQMQALSNGVHTALVALEAANSAGQSLDYAAFNAALAAYNSYATTAGIQH